MKNKLIEIIKKKWLRSVVLTIILIAIIICAYLAINFGIEKANLADIDMTKEKVYSISDTTRDKLQNIESDVTLSIYNMYDYVKDFAYQYARMNEHIKIEELDSITSKTEWKTKYGIGDSSSFMMVTSGDKEKFLEQYAFVTYDYSSNKQIDVTEETITNGILDVATQERPKVYFLTGHNLYSDGYFQYLEQDLKNEANEVERLNLLTTGKVPEDCDVLIITALKEDIKDIEKDQLIKYTKNGGKILLLMDPNLNGVKLTNFQKVLDEYGVSISDGFILEGDANKMILGAPNFVITTINSYNIIKNANMEINTCMVYPGKLNFVSEEELEKKNVTQEILATVSEKAFYRTDLDSSSQSKINSDEDADGAAVAALLTKQIDENKSSKLIVFANTTFATNIQFQVTSQYTPYAIDLVNNKDILLNSVSYLAERDDTITIRKNVEAVNYQVTEAQARIVLGIIFAIPILIIIIGITVWIIRRRKK